MKHYIMSNEKVEPKWNQRSEVGYRYLSIALNLQMGRRIPCKDFFVT